MESGDAVCVSEKEALWGREKMIETRDVKRKRRDMIGNIIKRKWERGCHKIILKRRKWKNKKSGEKEKEMWGVKSEEYMGSYERVPIKVRKMRSKKIWKEKINPEKLWLCGNEFLEIPDSVYDEYPSFFQGIFCFIKMI
jgi:hypothetical protein